MTRWKNTRHRPFHAEREPGVAHCGAKSEDGARFIEGGLPTCTHCRKAVRKLFPLTVEASGG